MNAIRSTNQKATAHARAKYASPLIALVILLLFGSAGLRLASGAGHALAQGSGETPPPSAPATTESQTEVAHCPTDEEIDDILSRLQEREAKLSARSGEIALREATLNAAEVRLSQRIAELKEVEASLTESMAKTATAAQDDVSTLMAVYAAMKPKDAATLFEAMDPEFAAGFLRQMRIDAAAAIFAGLSPTHAYAVSAVLAGRNASVPVPPAPTAAHDIREADQG